jgi:hypothetical protein
MSDKANQDQDGKTQEQETVFKAPTSQEELDALLADRVTASVEKALAPIKEKLNGAYAARDTAETTAATLAREKEEAETQALKDAGKHTEALERELATERENTRLANVKTQSLQDSNTKLTRDAELRNELSATAFRTPAAQEMAMREIKSNLVRDDKGIWMHKSGVTIAAAVNTFVTAEDNAFLLKQKTSKGSGQKQFDTTQKSEKDSTSLFSKSQAEVLAEVTKRLGQ